MNPVAKRTLLMASFLLMTALTWLSPSGETDDTVLNRRVPVKNPPATDAVRPPPRTTPVAIDVLGIVARDGGMLEDDADGRLFTPVSWKAPEVESPAVPVARSVEKPSAPSLPFTVLGRYDDKRRSVVFLQQGEQNLAVHVGDKIGANYQVESLQGTNMMLRYLPTNQLQTLDVGGAQ